MHEIKSDLENMNIVFLTKCYNAGIAMLTMPAYKHNNVWTQSPLQTNPSQEYFLSKSLRLTAATLLSFACPTQIIQTTQLDWKLFAATGECYRSKKDLRSCNTSENMDE